MTLTKFYTQVFGCQMNQSDAERISALLGKYELKSASSIDGANLIVFFTCGVRQSAEDRVYGQINNIKKKYPKKKIILTGCLAHRKDVQRRLKNKVDLFTTIENFSKNIYPVIARSTATKQSQAIQENTGLLRFARNDKKNYLCTTPKYSSTYTAYVPIMTGCNNFCAYCVVPYTRGREYSRPAKEILKEVGILVKKGYKEIILLGQNVNSYKNLLPCQGEVPEGRRGLKIQHTNATPPPAPSSTEEGRIQEVNFPKLLQLIEKMPGHFWISFLTSHPKDMSDELIKTISKSKKICEYISLPAQSGDNEILRRMNRKYTIGHYKSLIKKIRLAYKNPPPLPEGRCPEGTEGWELPPSISTDIIVGFPGETKKQFENTAKLLREMKFDMAYIAQYSPRPETSAWRLKDNVSKKEKVRREKVLTEILEKTALENNKNYVGKVVEILVDSESGGHTRTQKKVTFHSNLAYPAYRTGRRQTGKIIPIGSFAKVKITKAKAFGMEGRIK